MKNPKQNLAIMLLVSICLLAIVALQSCDDSDPEEVDVPLQGTWAIGSGYIRKDGVDVTSKHPGFQVTFSSDGLYTSVSATPLLKNSGTWVFSLDQTEVLLDGDFPVEIVSLNSEILNIKFNVDADHVQANGRSASLVGGYELQLERQ